MEAAVFVGAVIGAIRGLKLALPERINGLVTVLVAVALGVVVGLWGDDLGLLDVTVAEGIVLALAAVGFHETARQVG